MFDTYGSISQEAAQGLSSFLKKRPMGAPPVFSAYPFVFSASFCFKRRTLRMNGFT